MNQLSTLLKDFFVMLHCQVEGEEIMRVSKVPQDFERLYGKTAPYVFCFVKDFVEGDAEYISHSHHLINSISEYLRNKGNIALIRLTVGDNLHEALASCLQLHNPLVRIDKQINFDYIFKLTFETSMQYTNEHEKLLHTVYVHDNQVIDNFIIENYPHEPGEKSDIGLNTLREVRDVAKERIKQLLQNKIVSITEKLKLLLSKEIDRINRHYDSLIGEVEREIAVHTKRISELAKNTDDEQTIVRAKINRLHETIARLQEKVNPSEIAKEKEFHICEEKQKHSINIYSHLLNKTIIYYPVYDLVITIANGKKLRQISLQFNPLTKQIQDIFCEQCNKDIKNLFLCSSNHVLCETCLIHCQSCHGLVCGKCRRQCCSQCDRVLCAQCNQNCSRCKKSFCAAHLRTDFMNKAAICADCSLICS
ncbi:MAG: hypothetical protein AABX16_05355, partial [Nanoarchaeota archaeon]